MEDISPVKAISRAKQALRAFNINVDTLDYDEIRTVTKLLLVVQINLDLLRDKH